MSRKMRARKPDAIKASFPALDILVPEFHSNSLTEGTFMSKLRAIVAAEAGKDAAALPAIADFICSESQTSTALLERALAAFDVLAKNNSHAPELLYSLKKFLGAIKATSLAEKARHSALCVETAAKHMPQSGETELLVMEIAGIMAKAMLPPSTQRKLEALLGHSLKNSQITGPLKWVDEYEGEPFALSSLAIALGAIAANNAQNREIARLCSEHLAGFIFACVTFEPVLSKDAGVGKDGGRHSFLISEFLVPEMPAARQAAEELVKVCLLPHGREALLPCLSIINMVRDKITQGDRQLRLSMDAVFQRLTTEDSVC